MLQMTATSIEDLRRKLGINQIQLAKEARVNQSTISLIEGGARPNLASAKKIWEAINRLRAEKGLSRLGFEEIDWNW
jgi:predicted transcriptional regulator